MRARFGRYEAIRVIAAGGMATVHLGRALGEGGFERLVAIKVMHPHIATQPEFQAMFLDEARLAARIRHPNVVATLDVQRGLDCMFLVMDFIDGPSLYSLWREFRTRKKSLPVDIVLRIFVDTLSGLDAAHELASKDGTPLNLVHRDVSPHNILVGRDGAARITDFGVARAEARIASTQSGQLKGKLPYMPPEQLTNAKLDRRCDVYGAAVALWEALSGKRLFRADSEAGLMHMILGGAKVSPRDIRPDIPEPIARVCMRALEVDPDARPASAAVFADELESAAEESGVKVASTRQLASFIAKLPARVSEHPTIMDPTPSIDSDSREFPVATDASAEVPITRATVMTGKSMSPASQVGANKRGRHAMVLFGTLAVGLGLGAAFVGVTNQEVPASNEASPGAEEAGSVQARGGEPAIIDSARHQVAAGGNAADAANAADATEATDADNQASGGQSADSKASGSTSADGKVAGRKVPSTADASGAKGPLPSAKKASPRVRRPKRTTGYNAGPGYQPEEL